MRLGIFKASVHGFSQARLSRAERLTFHLIFSNIISALCTWRIG